MSAKNSTNTSRAARRLARLTDLTYAQALARLRAAGTIPDLDDPTALAAFVAATDPTGSPRAGTHSTPVSSVSTTSEQVSLREEARRLDGALELLMHEWDAHDEVDTTLGVALAEAGHELAALLRKAAPLQATPNERQAVTVRARDLEAACAHYDSLTEHDTNASIAIVGQLAPAIGEVRRTLGLARNVCGNCWYAIEQDATTATGWTHLDAGGKAGGFWCNPEFTRDNVHTTAEPLISYPAPDGDPWDTTDETDDEDAEGEAWGVCHFCGRNAGSDYHLAGVIDSAENNVVCDGCWDERLR